MYKLIIYGVKKNISKSRIKCYIEHSFGPIDDISLLPYIEWNIIKICTQNKKTYQSLLNFTSNSSIFSEGYRIQPLLTFKNEFNAVNPTVETTVQLNHDCLHQICIRCNLKTQIQLAKVSQDLLSIVGNIWLSKYRNKKFAYDFYEFEFRDQLSDAELQDFLTICGNFVENLTFNTIFYFPLIQRKFMNSSSIGGGNLMQNGKKFINETFCTHLQFFENLQSLEVHGKFISDFCIREIARYCKQLVVFKLLDSDTRWLQGTHLYLLSNLKELCVKDCAGLKPRHMLQTCKNLKNLQNLNISGCDLLQTPHFIIDICKYLNELQILHINAIVNGAALDAILQLPNLRGLHFYWLNSLPTFEMLYFEKLLEHKCDRLVTVSFSTDRVSVENESKEIWTQQKYALMRENATIRGHVWFLSAAATDDDTLNLFSQFVALREIHFLYCRPFAENILLDLLKISNSLKTIKLTGCRVKSDEQLLRTLERLQWCGDIEERRNICIEGLIPEETLERLRQHVLSLPYRFDCQPVIRSIFAEFE